MYEHVPTKNGNTAIFVFRYAYDIIAHNHSLAGLPDNFHKKKPNTDKKEPRKNQTHFWAKIAEKLAFSVKRMQKYRWAANTGSCFNKYWKKISPFFATEVRI